MAAATEEAKGAGGQGVCNPENLLQGALEAKEEGNALLKAKKYAEASQKYEFGVEILDKADGYPMYASDVTKVINAKVVLFANAAQAYLNQELYRRAEEAATKCLDLGASNPKALYRRALARRALKKLPDALKDVAALEELGPEVHSMDARELSLLKEDLERRKAEEDKRNEEEEEEADDDDKQLVEMKAAFDRVVEQYGLNDEETAEELSRYLTTAARGERTVTVADCARRWGMDEEDALVLLAWIEKGVKFKEESAEAAKNF